MTFPFPKNHLCSDEFEWPLFVSNFPAVREDWMDFRGEDRCLAETNRGATEVVSPLSGEGARSLFCGRSGDEISWNWIEENDGTTYIASYRWMANAVVMPCSKADRVQVLMSARSFSFNGKTLVIVAPYDLEAFDQDRSEIKVACLEPWFLGC